MGFFKYLLYRFIHDSVFKTRFKKCLKLTKSLIVFIRQYTVQNIIFNTLTVNSRYGF